MMQNKEKAEEMTQEVFIKAGQSLHRFIPLANHKTWLYRIATNACINEIIRASNKYEQLSIDPTHDPIATAESAPTSADEAIDIRQFMDQLKKEDQEIFSYKYFDQMTHEEIARIMHVSKRTIINHNNRIMQLFREWYHES